MTNHKNTTGHCMELFYILRETEKPGKILISVLGEDQIDRQLLTIRKGTLDWKRIFLTLPSGLNQIVITAVMDKDFVQSAAIDDIYVAPCSEFGKKIFFSFFFLKDIRMQFF